MWLTSFTPKSWRSLLLTSLTLTFGNLFAQDGGVLIDYEGNSVRHASAILQLNSDDTSDKGLLIPRVTLSSTSSTSPIYGGTPATGLMIYNTATVSDVTPGYYYWNGSIWTRLMNGNTTPLSGSGAATRVAFWNGTNSLSSDADLYWDNTASKRLGVGTASPSAKLHVDAGASQGGIRVDAINNPEIVLRTAGTTRGYLAIAGTAGGYATGTLANSLVLRSEGSAAHIVTGAGTIAMTANGSNVGIGTTAPGQRLDVVGGSIRTDNRLISTIATGTSPLQVTSTTLNTNLNADRLDNWHASELVFQQSNRDFPNGTLVQTDINYAVTSGEPWLLEIEGNSYGNQIPVDLKIQGYIYYDSLINVGGISNGTNITGLSAFNYGGYLCFWFPSQGYWNGYNVFVNDSYAGIKKNRLVSITHQAKPGGITKEVNLTPKIRQSWHSGNFTPSSYTPTTGGTGYIQNQVASDQSAGFRISGNGLFNGGNVGIGTTAPSTKLQVNHTSSGALTGTSAYGGIQLDQDAGNDGFTGITTSATNSGTQGGILFQGSGAYGSKIHFMTTSSYATGMQNRMTLDHTGKLGIATTAPQTLLHVNLGAGGTNTSPAIRIDGLSNYPSLELGIKGNYDGMIRTYGNDLHLYAGHWRTSGTPATENHNLSFYTSQIGNTNWETPKMYLRYDGNVGIGTTAPGAKLEVTEVAGSFPVLRVNHDANSGETGIRFRTKSSAGSSAHADISWTATGSETGNLIFRVPYTNERMRIQSNGNVGIGTTAPTRRLEVYGAAGNYPMRIGSPDGYLDIGPANAGFSHFSTDRPLFYFNTGVQVDGGLIGSYDENLQLRTGGTTRITALYSNGNVGIATASPTQKLDVAGNIKLDDNMMVEGTSVYRVFRNLATYNSSSGAAAGAFVINTNQPWNGAHMFRVKLEGYFYDATAPFEMTIGGYMYTGNNFYNYGYINVGAKKLSVRFARNAGTNTVAIIVGDEATSYSYPKLSVTSYMQGHSSPNEAHADGWSISQITSLSGYDYVVGVPDITHAGQGATVYSNETETNLASNNTGTYSSSSGVGWTPGTWQDVPAFSVARTITAGNMVEITASGLVEGDNYNYFVPSCVYFRLLRGATEIARTAVYLTPANYVPTNFWFFNSGDFSMSVVETATSGSQTYKVQYWMPNEYSATENVRIGSRRLNVMEMNQ